MKSASPANKHAGKKLKFVKGQAPAGKTTMSLLDSSPVYKPFRYPWAYDAWLMQQRIHWLPEEVPLADDVKDWQQKLTPAEKTC